MLIIHLNQTDCAVVRYTCTYVHIIVYSPTHLRKLLQHLESIRRKKQFLEHQVISFHLLLCSSSFSRLVPATTDEYIAV